MAPPPQEYVQNRRIPPVQPHRNQDLYFCIKTTAIGVNSKYHQPPPVPKPTDTTMESRVQSHKAGIQGGTSSITTHLPSPLTTRHIQSNLSSLPEPLLPTKIDYPMVTISTEPMEIHIPTSPIMSASQMQITSSVSPPLPPNLPTSSPDNLCKRVDAIKRRVEAIKDNLLNQSISSHSILLSFSPSPLQTSILSNTTDFTVHDSTSTQSIIAPPHTINTEVLIDNSEAGPKATVPFLEKSLYPIKDPIAINQYPPIITDFTEKEKM